MRMTEQSAEQLVTVLASKEPVPGGGGAAALVGAIGVALGNMVGSLTLGKKKYQAVEKEIKRLKMQADDLQAKLLGMVEKDAEVFAPLAKAYGMPKDTPEQRVEKEKVMKKVLYQAALTPMMIMQLCMEALKLIERFAAVGSRLAVSDAGCAAVCCVAALKAASLNVFINTKSMKDRETAEQFNQAVEKMLREGSLQAETVFADVRLQLN